MTRWRGRVAGRPAWTLLTVVGSLLGAGGAAHLLGAGPLGDGLWIAAGAVGALDELVRVTASLRRGAVGVDAIAVLALLGALLVGEYLAAAVISGMVVSGEALEGWAAGRARRDLRALLERAPRMAHRYTASGELETVPIDQIAPGDAVLVATGEIVPIDGLLLAAATFDESALTGEPLPVDRAKSEPIRSGVVNAGAPVDVRVTTSAADSTYAGIIRLVSQAESSRAPFVRLADHYALGFLALTLVGAGAAWIIGGATRAVAVLVVATPCPLILAAPIAFVAGLSRSARRGIVIKGADVLERLASCTTLLIDKTGTLTSGEPTLVGIAAAPGVAPDDVLCLAGSLDQVSPHVLARAIVLAAQERLGALALPDHVEEVAGQGVRGVIGGRRVSVGRAEWVGFVGTPDWAASTLRRASRDGSLTVFVAIDGSSAGVLVLDDPIRLDAAMVIRNLRRGGITRVVMVTGDRAEVADNVGAAVGVDDVKAECSPTEKLDVVRDERRRAPTIMVGDGINDAPALALADVGIAMGARGATASSETADVVLTLDRLERAGEARSIAGRSLDVAIQSVVAGMAMSLAAMGVAAVGFLPAVWGAVLQEGIDVLVIVNALRALRPAGSELRLAEQDAAITRRFQREHRRIRPGIDRLLAAADRLSGVDLVAAMAEVRAARQLLDEVIGPHEQAEQDVLYPALDRILGGSDPMGPMTQAHAEIARQARRLGQIVDDIGSGIPDAEDIDELRRLLYGLHAVLRLHTAQEDESYLALSDDSGQDAL